MLVYMGKVKMLRVLVHHYVTLHRGFKRKVVMKEIEAL